MNTKPVKKCARVQIPQTHSKVNTARNEMGLLISLMQMVRIQQAVHSSCMPQQQLVWWPIC
jgi:hypothetical protein